jgi:CBS-domain-containing membrane protein
MSDSYGRYGAQRGPDNESWRRARESGAETGFTSERQSEPDYENRDYRDRLRRSEQDPRWRQNPGQERDPRYARSRTTSRDENYNRTPDRYPADFNTGMDYDEYEGETLGQSSYGQGSARSHLRCRDVMIKNVTTAAPETSIREIARIMRADDVGAVPIVSNDGRLAGIVTDRDLVVTGLTKYKADTDLSAEDCMSTDVFTAKLNDRIVEAIEQMGDHQVRRIPIVDNKDRLVGIVSLSDVALASNDDRELRRVLEHISKPSSWYSRLTHFLGLN